MDREFWLEAWRQGRIGFHRDAVNPALVEHEAAFLGGGPHRVLVPLCGKSLDLGWLAERGHEVVGVELSPIAVDAVFEEGGRDRSIREVDGLRLHDSPGLTVVEGDFFALQPDHLGTFDRVWDRAAMIALPPELRGRYVGHLQQLARPGAKVLLRTLEYDPSVMSGPPFSVPEEEVRMRYQGAEVQRLDQADVLASEPRWAERGHRWMRETTWLVRLP